MHPFRQPATSRPQGAARPQPAVRQFAPPTLADVEAALAFVSPDDRETWLRMALAIRAEFGDDHEAFAIWDRWSQAGSSYRRTDARDVWRSAKSRSVTIATLFYEARANGYRPTSIAHASAPAPRPPKPPPVDDRKPWDASLQTIWNDALPIDNTIGATYLIGRQCALPPVAGDVRFAPSRLHWIAQRTFPALVSRVTDAVTGAPQTLHFTFLRADGSGKADVDRPKLVARGYRKAGGVIRLWPDADVETRLTIAEGIETALTAAHARPPAWACIDAGNVSTFPVLAGIESLLIVADRDAKGLQAAQACGQRWRDAGRSASIYTPQTDGDDLNDVVGRAAA